MNSNSIFIQSNNQTAFTLWFQLINNGTIALPSILFKFYASIGISEEQMMLILHIHQFQTLENIGFPTVSQIEERMSIDHHQIMIQLQSLMKRGFLLIDELDENGIRSEVYNLEPFFVKLYEKVSNAPAQTKLVHSQTLLEKIRNRDVFTAFEQEFGRPLSPLECESLSMWLDQDRIAEELVIAALREAVFAGKLSFRYIDRILFEWQRNNVRTLEEAKKHAAHFRSQTPSKTKAANQTSDQAKKNNFKIFNWLEDSKSN